MAGDVAKWLYRLSANYEWTSPFALDEDYAFADSAGRVRLVLERNGAITVTRGYTWNGCSPKVSAFDLLIGTPEGVVNARTGQRKTYFASLVHDALYQFLADGLPLTRRQADLVFLHLMRESGFRLAPIYWLFVRALGGLVHAATRRTRRWRGTATRVDAGTWPPPAPPAAHDAASPAAGATRGMSAALYAYAARPPAISAMRLATLDHLVLTVADVDATAAFYVRVLGMDAVTFGAGRRALAFGAQKINLHAAGREFEPHAAAPTRGSADLCFLTDVPLDEVIAHLRACGVAIEEGPVMRTGATGPIRSVYLRDPDGNLIEVSNRVAPA
jgi:catechol 2,3-dioxygenase-like lactoylglutathione lyase family enzyme